MDPERSLESGPQPSQAMPAVQIRYVGIGQLTLYLVSEDELRMIETGGPSATLLNLAVGFLFLAAGLLGSLLLSEPSKSLYKFNVFVILLVCSFIAGGVLLIVWSRFRKDASETTKRIRKRAIPSAGATVMEGPAGDGPAVS
jgi:hypothetical protein